MFTRFKYYNLFFLVQSIQLCNSNIVICLYNILWYWRSSTHEIGERTGGFHRQQQQLRHHNSRQHDWRPTTRCHNTGGETFWTGPSNETGQRALFGSVLYSIVLSLWPRFQRACFDELVRQQTFHAERDIFATFGSRAAGPVTSSGCRKARASRFDIQPIVRHIIE